MIKAVFFDLYYTLVRYEPPQEEVEAMVLKGFGIDVPAEVFRRPLIAANEYIYEEIARKPLSQRSQEEKIALYAQYQRIVLTEGGIEADDGLVMAVLGKTRQYPMKLVLFDDVTAALDDLKGRGLVLGLISNVEHDIGPVLGELGLLTRLQVVVTSSDAGYNKPRPEIFQEAARRAGVQPSEAAYVGDQYQVDCLGAAGAGMKGILIDRGDYMAGITDCSRIRGLGELAGHIM